MPHSSTTEEIKTLEFRTHQGNLYIPTNTQRRFHESTSKYRCLFGGFGSGKTTPLVIEALTLMFERPGSLGMITRESYRALEDSTRRVFLKIADDMGVVKNWRQRDNMLTIRNGAQCVFRTTDSPGKWKSTEFSWIAMDEVTESTIEAFQLMQGRLREEENSRWIGATNPNGMDWSYQTFVANGVEGFSPDADKSNYVWYKAPSTENAHNLPSTYISDLIKTYPENWVRRYIYAEFNDFEGKVFPNLNHEKHVLADDKIKQLVNPKLEHFRSIDHGYRSPTACVWGCSDTDGNLIIYDEYFLAESIIRDNCNAIIRQHPEFEGTTLIDPSTLRSDAYEGSSVYNEYAKYGLPAMPADNSRKASFDKINSMLAEIPTKRLFISDKCVNLIREMDNLHYPKISFGKVLTRNQSEDPVKKDDHAVDALRYMVTYYWSAIEERKYYGRESTLQTIYREQMEKQKLQVPNSRYGKFDSKKLF